MFTVDGKHPLLVGTRETIGSWHQWLQCWEQASNLETRLGLLSIGLEVPYGYESYDHNHYGIADRICFYLSVADGHRHPTNYSSADGRTRIYGSAFGERVESVSKALQRLAKQAFKALSGRYFRNKNDRLVPGRFEDAYWLRYEEVVKKLLWFFRVDDRGRLENLDPHWDNDASSLAATKFIEDLCILAFDDESDTRGRDYEVSRAIYNLLVPHRAAMIPILCCKDEWVLRLTNTKRARNVDAACQDALWESAKRADIISSRDKPHDTIEQAIHSGSAAAIALLVIRTIEKQDVLAKKRAALVHKKEEAEAALNNLMQDL